MCVEIWAVETEEFCVYNIALTVGEKKVKK